MRLVEKDWMVDDNIESLYQDNKVMMVATPSEEKLEEVITNKLGISHNTPSNLEQNRSRPKFRTRLRKRFLFDISIVVIVALVVCLVEFGIIPNTKQGFICKDPKISRPFTGDTISVTTLLLSSYFGPIVIIILVEYLKEKSFQKVCGRTVWNYYKDCLIGATLVLLITEIIKVIMGEPRPHFLDSCDPEENVMCEKGAFIFDYTCRNTRLSNFFRNDITRSFPSGHTSVSLFIAIYCSYLIQVRIPTNSVSSLTKPFLIAVCLTWSLTCSLTRITDNRHHWWDVLAGAFLGLFGAIYTISLLHLKEKRKVKDRIIGTSITTLSEVKKDSESTVI